MAVRWRRVRHASFGGAGSPAGVALAFSVCVGGSVLVLPRHGRCQLPDVPGGVNVGDAESILDALGLENPFGSDDGKPVVDLWYFWVCIAVIAIFVVTGSFFTYRGFKRWRNVREENRLKLVVQHIDQQTDDWIIDMSKRTGRPVGRCLAAGARHCAGQAGDSRAFNKAMTFAAQTMKRHREGDDVGAAVTKLPATVEEDE
jgi:hypothetical protein